MPGLVGLITLLPRDVAKRQLLRMVETIRHEEFYVSGIWSDESLGVHVAWVAHRGSFADGMPLRNERGDATLIFSGEEFPEPGIVTTLQQRGHVFELEGSSYLVHRYEEESDFPKGLNGRFHGVIADRALRSVTVFNDRFGLQRLYYHQASDAFYFAAEAKAILRVRPELRQVNSRSLGEFLVCGCVLENRTLFKGISVFPPGSAWHFREGALEKKVSYFTPGEWEELGPLGPEEYYTQLRDAFVNNLPRYFNGKQRVGVSLTGGLDTRIIMAWRKQLSGSVPCYTFGSMYRDNQDVQLARKVAAICGQSHEVITTGKEFLARFPHYAERSIYLSDCCVDLSRSPDLYVNEKAREIAPVRVVGTYGSEMLLQAVMFKAEQPLKDLFRPEMMSYLRTAEETYHKSKEAHPVTFIAFKQSPWHHFGILGLEQTQVGVRSPYLDNAVVKLVYRAPGSVTTNKQGRLRLVREGNPDLAKLRTDRGIGGPASFFVHAYLEFLFKAEYAYDYGMPQWIARIGHIFAPFHLERFWLGQHKVFHFRVWYRDELAEYVREMLLDRRSLARPYIVPQAVQRMVSYHLNGIGNYTMEIHRLLALELTHRLFIDSN